MRRKGELSQAGIDRDWPHQVAVRVIEGQNVTPLSHLKSLCPRRYEVHDHLHRYRVYCFSDLDEAYRFRDVLGAEDFDPRDRVGASWRRSKRAKRDAE